MGAAPLEHHEQHADHVPEELIFDSKLTTYAKPREPNRLGIQFRFFRLKRAGLNEGGHADSIWSSVKDSRMGGQHVHEPVVSGFFDPGL